MLLVVLVSLAPATAACSRDRIVKVGWDPPAVAPDRYWILIDGAVVREIPPPPLNDECRCLMVSVLVPRGPHTLQIVAYSVRDGASAPSASVTVR